MPSESVALLPGVVSSFQNVGLLRGVLMLYDVFTINASSVPAPMMSQRTVPK